MAGPGGRHRPDAGGRATSSRTRKRRRRCKHDNQSGLQRPQGTPGRTGRRLGNGGFVRAHRSDSGVLIGSPEPGLAFRGLAASAAGKRFFGLLASPAGAGIDERRRARGSAGIPRGTSGRQATFRGDVVERREAPRICGVGVFCWPPSSSRAKRPALDPRPAVRTPETGSSDQGSD